MATPPARHLQSRRRIRRRSVHATTIKDLEVTRLEKKRPEVTAFHIIYKLLASLMYWSISFQPGWSGAEIKSIVHIALPKWP